MEQVVEKLKILLLSFLPAVLASYLGALAIPFGLLVVACIIDYATGLAAAPYRGQVRNSKDGWKGIVKKLLTLLMIVVGMILDAGLYFVELQSGIDIPIPEAFPVASIICMWLLFNELISIIENLGDTGINVPFLLPLVKWVKKKVNDTVTLPDGEEKQ